MPGRVFRTTMCHDTGSSLLTLFKDEIILLYNRPVESLNFRRKFVRTTMGNTSRYCFPIEMRIITTSHGEVVMDWTKVNACVVPFLADSKRLSPKELERTLYTCMTPRTGNLYVAVNKTQLVGLVPANE
jgi:hypothetical protein